MYDYADGIPFPPEYGPIAHANAIERLHDLLFSMCEDFSTVSICGKTRAMTVNTNQAMAVYMARIHAYDTLEEQLNHYVSVGALPESDRIGPNRTNRTGACLKKITVLEVNDNYPYNKPVKEIQGQFSPILYN
jgi:hypothetical protein